jgi:protein-S-isoprenylcysteine O-methyltransferase Ste14
MAGAVTRRMVQLFVLMLLQAAVLFVAAGTLAWPAGWLYLGLYAVLIAAAAVALLPGHTELVAERARGTEGAEPWDRVVTRLIAVVTVALLAVAGLDERWAWTAPLPLAVRALGAALLSGGYVLVLAAMRANPFFSQVVRIQTERGHRAVTAGPYRVVRHPGYLGMLASALGTVGVLDAPWSLVPWAGYTALVLTRTVLEDRTLRSRLPGYAEYATRTRWRLLPGLW